MDAAAAPALRPRPRLRSLDAFRGATIALMILVNNAGDWSRTYAPLLHAQWHGWTPTDLVFPFFLFILGAAIPLALGDRRRDPAASARLHAKILRRAAILFALGLLLTWFPFFTVNWARARVPGVLQRIALVYLAAALAHLHLRPRGRAVLGAGLLGAYWAAMKLVPVPGFGAGDLSPQGNLAFWLDHAILGAHTWRYAPGPGDPEGILSTLPAIVSALAGIFVGELLRSARTVRRKLGLMLVWGAAATVAGLALQPLFPINKNLWSPTYVIFTTGAAMLALGAAYALIDLLGVRRWARPFEAFGTNAIAAYVGSGLLAKILLAVRWSDGAGHTVTLNRFLYSTVYAAHLPEYVASLAWALTHVAIWWAVVAALDRRKIYFKI
ncbi:MAG: acyltransferase family protein [Acidobacteriota bacterium]